jgi:hypothetical protein
MKAASAPNNIYHEVYQKDKCKGLIVLAEDCEKHLVDFKGWWKPDCRLL